MPDPSVASRGWKSNHTLSVDLVWRAKMAKLLVLAISMALCSCDVVAGMGRGLEANGLFLTRLADQYNPAYEVPPSISKASPALVTPLTLEAPQSALGPIY
jgi:hypothetical protein